MYSWLGLGTMFSEGKLRDELWPESYMRPALGTGYVYHELY